MAKRFTDNGKWSDSWFCDLSQEFKLVYIYLLDQCDTVGVWKPNIKLAEFQLGFKIDWEDFKNVCGPTRIYVMPNTYWWIVKFCDYQYKTIPHTSKSPAINSYIDLLQKHKLWDKYKGENSIIENGLIELPLNHEPPKTVTHEKPPAGKTITIGTQAFTGTTSEWLMLNKESAIESLMINYPKLDRDKVFAKIDAETIQYHFKDHNHAYNYFKSACEKLSKPANSFSNNVVQDGPVYKKLLPKK